MLRPPRSTLFPYTTLFRSLHVDTAATWQRRCTLAPAVRQRTERLDTREVRALLRRQHGPQLGIRPGRRLDGQCAARRGEHRRGRVRLHLPCMVLFRRVRRCAAGTGAARRRVLDAREVQAAADSFDCHAQISVARLSMPLIASNTLAFASYMRRACIMSTSSSVIRTL